MGRVMMAWFATLILPGAVAISLHLRQSQESMEIESATTES
jgi:hypothetical protein